MYVLEEYKKQIVCARAEFLVDGNIGTIPEGLSIPVVNLAQSPVCWSWVVGPVGPTKCTSGTSDSSWKLNPGGDVLVDIVVWNTDPIVVHLLRRAHYVEQLEAGIRLGHLWAKLNGEHSVMWSLEVGRDINDGSSCVAGYNHTLVVLTTLVGMSLARIVTTTSAS